VTGADAYISFSAIAVTPTSRGTVEARSADPTVLPSVDPQYLATDVDRAIMRDAVKTLEAIASSPAWKEVLDAEIDPGGAAGFSAAEIDRKLRDLTVTGWHYVRILPLFQP
jgi:choline dehydrogenase